MLETREEVRKSERAAMLEVRTTERCCWLPFMRKRREKAQAAGIPAGPALDRIVEGCKMLKQFELSGRAAALILEIEANADRLMPLMRTDEDPLPEIWPCPEPRQQSDWIQVCADGGRLLHSLGCIVAIGSTSQDWVMGRFFVSDRGMAIEGSSASYVGTFEVALWTGLLPWLSIEVVESDSSEMRLQLAEGAYRDTLIRLQLRGEEEYNRVKEAWTHYVANHNFYSFVDGSKSRFFSYFEEDGVSPLVDSPGNKKAFKANLPFTPSFVLATNALPQGGYNKPLVSDRISGVDFPTIRRILEKDDDWFMMKFQSEVLKAVDIQATPWTQGQVVPGTLVRRLTSSLPKPDDIPKSMAQMIGFPDWLNGTLAARLQFEDDTITLHMHSCAFNAPYGDYQRLEDVLVFRPDGDDGIRVTKFMKIVWVKAMPFFLNAVKGFLESKVKQDGLSTFPEFLKIVQEECVRDTVAA